jgi:hypothetical protein
MLKKDFLIQENRLHTNSSSGQEEDLKGPLRTGGYRGMRRDLRA